MAQTQRKTCLTIADKIAIIEEHETKNTVTRELSEKYKCSYLDISNILEQKHYIKEKWLRFGTRYKRRRKYDNINQIVHLWYQDARSQNMTVTASIIKSCAKDVATHLDQTSFKPTETWLKAFKKDYQIEFKSPKNVCINNGENFGTGSEEIQSTNWIDELSELNSALHSCSKENTSDHHKPVEENILITPGSSQLINQNINPEPKIELDDIFFNFEPVDQEIRPATASKCDIAQNDFYKTQINKENYIKDSINTSPPCVLETQDIKEKAIFSSTPKTYSEVLDQVYGIEDFAISQNDITLLKLSSVMRYFVEAKLSS